MDSDTAVIIKVKPKLVERDGQWFAQIPVADFEALMRGNAGSVTPAKKTPPSAIKERVAKGENPIRAFRQYLGMTQKQLAEAAGIARPYLTEIETSKKSGSIASLKAIAKALDVELTDLV